jgi:hypothetical protein
MMLRHVLLAAALAATLAAVWLSGKEGAGDVDSAAVVAAAPRRAVAAPKTAPQALAALAEPAPRFVAGGPDLFPPQSWHPPPTPTPVVVAPPPLPPQAPPLPFKYVGRWDAGEGVSIFLAQGDRVVSVRVGENLAQWHLDSVDASGMNFTYLPLQQQRQLRFGP